MLVVDALARNHVALTTYATWQLGMRIFMNRAVLDALAISLIAAHNEGQGKGDRRCRTIFKLASAEEGVHGLPEQTLTHGGQSSLSPVLDASPSSTAYCRA